MIRTVKKYISFIFLLVLTSDSLAVIVGSNTAVSRQAATTFPRSDTNNTMLGFAVFEQGFTLQDRLTNCTFNDLFPLSGTLQFNGGSLFLQQDCVLDSAAVFATTGSIFGNNLSFKFTTTRDMLVPRGAGGRLFQQIATLNVGFSASTISWAYDSTYLGFGCNAGTFPTGVLLFNGTTLTSLVTTTLPVAVNTVRFHPTDYYLARGSQANTAVQGVQVFRFTPGPNTLVPVSGASLNTDVRSLAWHPSGNFLAAGRNVGNGQIQIYPFNKTTGALGTPTTWTSGNSVSFSGSGCLDWSSDGTYLVAGFNNNSSTNLRMFLFDGANITVTVDFNTQVNVLGLSFSPTGTFIALGLSGSANRLRLAQFLVGSGTLTNVLNVSENVSVNSVDWRYDGDWLGFGRQSGGGTEFRIYEFNKTAITLTLAESVDTGAANITEVEWTPDGEYIATSDSASVATVYQFRDGRTAATTLFSNAAIGINSNIIFNFPARISGNCIITGNGGNNYLGFGSNGLMYIESGASLLCQNITMTQIANKIIMVDNTSTLTLDNVTWELDGNYSFTQGYFYLKNNVHILGNNNVFTYQSGRQALIAPYSTLLMDGGLTFSYASPNTTRDLFGMTDRTSVWTISGVTLASTTTGMQLTKGTLRVDGTCNIASAATVPAQGIMFGDGITANNDLDIQFMAGSGFNIASGYLVYNNVSG